MGKTFAELAFHEKYDCYFRIQLTDQLKLLLADDFEKSKSIDSTDTFDRQLINKILDVLNKAIGWRTLRIDFRQHKNAKLLPEDEPLTKLSNKYDFGILLNPDTYTKLLDKGPSGDSPEAAEFRAFWGEKSEMRKFADNSVCEAVVWQANNQMKSRAIIEDIIKFVLQRHIKLPPEQIKFNGSEIEEIVAISSPAHGLLGSGEEQFRELNLVFEEFAQSLRLLEDLPLKINKITPVSSILRRTEFLPPMPCSSTKILANHYVRGQWTVPRPGSLFAPPWCPSIEVQLTLESSGKWPDNVEAVKILKTAFYLQISQLLEKQIGVVSNSCKDCLYAFYKGYVFRLYIAYHREITLLKMTKTDAGVVQMKDTEQSAQLDKDIIERPKISAQISGLVQKFPSYALTVRCFKRWLSCHLLADYLCDELIELLVARVYLAHLPYSVPTSCFTAFLRVLRLLNGHGWLTSPLIVNFNEELDGRKLSEIRTNFLALRPTLPPMCVVTPQDTCGVLWTRPQPTSMILERLCQLAASSSRFVEKNLLERSALDIKTIFRTPLDSYDILVHLNDRRLPKRFMTLDHDKTHSFPRKNYSTPESSTNLKRSKKPKRLLSSKQPQRNLPVIDYDPLACFVRDIQLKHGKNFMCFYDKFGGDVVGLLLRPNVKVDIGSLTQRIEQIGSGLVKKIRVIHNSN